MLLGRSNCGARDAADVHTNRLVRHAAGGSVWATCHGTTCGFRRLHWVSGDKNHKAASVTQFHSSIIQQPCVQSKKKKFIYFSLSVSDIPCWQEMTAACGSLGADQSTMENLLRAQCQLQTPGWFAFAVFDFDLASVVTFLTSMSSDLVSRLRQSRRW